MSEPFMRAEGVCSVLNQIRGVYREIVLLTPEKYQTRASSDRLNMSLEI